MSVVIPLASVLSIEIELSIPVPSRIVPVARLGHVSDVRVNVLSVLTGLAPAGSATTRAITKTAGTKASRLIENLLSLPKRVIHPRYQRLSTAKSRRYAHTDVDRVVRARNGDQLHRLEHDCVGEGSERLWHVEASRNRSDKLAELLIDCEEDRVLRAVLVGMLREPGA
jgi:hypothetical protein